MHKKELHHFPHHLSAYGRRREDLHFSKYIAKKQSAGGERGEKFLIFSDKPVEPQLYSDLDDRCSLIVF